MTPEGARELAECWGAAGREYLMRRTQAGTAEGAVYAAHLQALSPAEAAAEIRSMFALDASADLADAVAGDLGLDPEKAVAIAKELAAGRKRLARAPRAFSRQIVAKD